jgi:hypothetical protein
MSTRSLLLLGLLGCGYDAPDNPYADPFPNVISGTVLAGDLPDVSHVVLLLTDAANPMPPTGTGSPTTFSTVPAARFSTPEAGVRAASYAVTGVPDGTWLLTAVMDLDHNFHPAVPTLAGATCGDQAGGHLASLAGSALAPITTAGGEQVADVTVVLGLQVPTQRPAFSVSELADTVDPAAPGAIFRLESQPIEAAYGPDLALSFTGPFDPTAPNPCDTAFWVHLTDADDDGLIDPHPSYPPELGVPDVWPRVFLEWLGAPIDTDGDELPDDFDRGDLPAGTRFVSEGVPFAPQLAAIDPTRPETVPPIGATFPATTLDVLFPAAGRRLDPDGTSTTLTDPAALPAGAWSVTVVAQTGQTWRVPNELDTSLHLSALVPEPGVTSARDAGQGTWVELARP